MTWRAARDHLEEFQLELQDCLYPAVDFIEGLSHDAKPLSKVAYESDPGDLHAEHELRPGAIQARQYSRELLVVILPGRESIKVLLGNLPLLHLPELLKEGAQLLSSIQYEGHLAKYTGSVEVRFRFEESDGEVQCFEFLGRVLEGFGRASYVPTGSSDSLDQVNRRIEQGDCCRSRADNFGLASIK